MSKAARFAFGSVLAALTTGCQAPLKPVFPVHNPPIFWPPPPDTPRIRYIGELTGEASLGVQPRGLEVLGEIFTGPKPKIAFSTPTAVAVRDDLVFVADGQAQAVYRMDLTERTFSAIRQAGGKNMEWPIDLAIHGDSLLVADSKRAAIFVYGLDGRYRMSIGEGELTRPGSIAVDEAGGDLWVVDCAAHDCKVFDPAGHVRRRIGKRGPASGEFNFPVGVAVHRETGVAVADSMNFRVQLFGLDGSPRLSFGQKGDAAGDFSLPRDLAMDSAGHLYVLDNQFENVQIFDRGGRLLMALGQEGRGPGEFYLPAGISIDRQDRIWIADTYNRRVQVFQFLKEVTE